MKKINWDFEAVSKCINKFAMYTVCILAVIACAALHYNNDFLFEIFETGALVAGVICLLALFIMQHVADAMKDSEENKQAKDKFDKKDNFINRKEGCDNE